MGGFCGDTGWDGDCGGGSKCSGGDDGNCSDIALDDKGSVELRSEVSWKNKDWMINSDAVVFSCLKNELILLVARFFSWGLCRSLFTWAEEYVFEAMAISWCLWSTTLASHFNRFSKGKYRKTYWCKFYSYLQIILHKFTLTA